MLAFQNITQDKTKGQNSNQWRNTHISMNYHFPVEEFMIQPPYIQDIDT